MLELNGEPVEVARCISFTINDVVNNAKKGDFALLTMLNQTTMVRVYDLRKQDLYIKSCKRWITKDIKKKYCVCTPMKKGANLAKLGVGYIVELSILLNFTIKNAKKQA